MFSCFDNNCHKSHKKLNICEFTKNNLNPLNFLTPVCVWRGGGEIRKFKGLRLILVNSQIFNFFMAFVTIVVKATKYK